MENKMTALPYPKVHVIINPAAGQDEPILNVLNHVFHPAGVDWDNSLTHKSGDATRLAAEAAAAGVDLVAAYGGDGTQMEVANGLLGTGVPQAILPGGTGNAMAHDLGISLNLGEAAELIVTSPKRQAVDLARIGDTVFMLRAYAGVSADEAASREEKDKYGQLAYIQAGLKFLKEVKTAHYKATVDGEIIEVEAVICYILNAGSIGVQPLRAVSKYIFHHEGSDAGVYHWRGKEITFEADPVQDVWIDGELGGKTPFTVNTLPQALEIVVPA